MPSVSFVPFEEIDKVKWNSCIHYAVNGNIFAYHWYLTNTVRHWDALVYDDYETVLPLISRRSFPGINELYQPLLMGKLGVFSVNMVSKEKVNKMLRAIPDRYHGIDMQLNDLNRLDKASPFDFNEGRDHSLYLKPSYEQLHANYSKSVRNLLSETEQEWYFDNSISPEDFVELMTQYSATSFDKHTAHRILYNGLHRGIAMMMLLRNTSGEFVAGALFLSSHGRLFHILSATNPAFGSFKARAYLWDRIIRTYSDRPLVLDFNQPQETYPAAFGARSYDFYTLNKPVNWLEWPRQFSQWITGRSAL